MTKQKKEMKNKIEVPFGWLPQEVIDGEYNLSAKAVGILLYLNNRPDNWTFYKSEITDRFSDGKSSITSGIKELQEKGFLEIDKSRDDKGRITGSKWVLDIPDTKDDSPRNRLSDPGLSDAGKPATNKKYSSKKESNKNAYLDTESVSKPVSIFLQLFENYTSKRHYQIPEDKLYNIRETLDKCYYESVYDYRGKLREFFEGFDTEGGERLPRLEYFHRAAKRYFDDI